MKKTLKILAETAIILLPIAATAALSCYFIYATPQAPAPIELKAPKETPQVVSVIPAPVRNIVPQVLAYGIARPAETNRLVARTQGPIVYIHPDLHTGVRIPKHAVLVRIDSTPHKLNLAGADAEILRLEAELEQINRKVTNDRLSLEIETASLHIAEHGLARSRSLLEKNAASQVDVDADERTMLAQKRIVQSLQNSLSLAESITKAKAAELDSSHIALAKAHLELSYTEVRSPADTFLSDLFVQEGQVVTAGQPLLETYSGRAMAVDCQIDYDHIKHLLDSDTRLRLDHDLRYYRHSRTLDELLALDVRFADGPKTVEYKGRLRTVELSSDKTALTVALTVAVDNPSPDPNSSRQNLLKGTCCEIQISATPLPNQIVLPHRAVHHDHVYVLNEADRLERRYIKTAFSQPDYVVISHGLQPNENVLLSSPVPPTEGLLVDPVEDKELLERLQTTESPALTSKSGLQLVSIPPTAAASPQTPDHKD